MFAKANAPIFPSFKGYLHFVTRLLPKTGDIFVKKKEKKILYNSCMLHLKQFSY